MSNYYGVCRTNYFRVKNEDEYASAFKCLCSEDDIHDFTKVVNGITWHGFGCYSPIVYTPYDEDDDDYDGGIYAFLELMKNIICDDDSFIYMESGYEKLRYVTGFVYVVTKDGIEEMSIESWALSKAREILGDDYNTKMEY